jgi:hypothetical protein
MILTLTIDVEEEGLFTNRYSPSDAPVENVPRLELLDPIFREFGIRPTLLPTYQVVRHASHGDFLLQLKERWDGEIGAHLHPWNTPPLAPTPYPEPVPSELMDAQLLKAKLAALLESLSAAGIAPVSFRMGRFNMGPKMLAVLGESGILVDSSVAPMRRYYGGADHLAAPVDPYYPDPNDIRRPGSANVLEVPVTIVPATRGLGALLERVRRAEVFPDGWTSWIASEIASFPAQPFWTGLRRLKTAVRLHRGRGGRVLSIFFHSSELFPGGAPAPWTDVEIQRFLAKLRRFLGWLVNDVGVESLTLSELRKLY